MRTVQLVERRSLECELAARDVDYLLAHHSSHLQVRPARHRRVVLTPTRLVGLIVGESTRFVIRPKLPIRSFARLLDLDLEPSVADWLCEFPVFDLLVELLAKQLADLQATGLRRGYQDHAHVGPILQGRLDLVPTLREYPHRERLHSLRQDLTADVPCNRILRATVEWLAHSPLLPERSRDTMRSYLSSLGAIRFVSLSEGLFAEVLCDPALGSYGPLIDCCRLLFEGLALASGLGKPGHAFLVDLERLFERRVTQAIRERASGAGVIVEEQPVLSLPIKQGEAVRMRPDVVLRDRKGGVVVLDAKWKRIRPGRPHPADLQQVLAYGLVFGAREMILVHPGRADFNSCIALTEGRGVHLWNVRVTGSREAWDRSFSRMGRAARQVALKSTGS